MTRATLVVVALVIAGEPACAQLGSLYLFDVVRRPSYRLSFERMIHGHTNLPAWASTPKALESATVTAGKVISVEGTDREIFHACKQHDCSGNELVVMFSSYGQKAQAVFATGGQPPIFLGAPDAQEAKALIGKLD